MKRGYQRNYINVDPQMLDQSQRKLKAKKIISILRDFCESRKISLKNLRALELGCSVGGMSGELARNVSRLTAVDIDKKALSIAKTRHQHKRILFQYADALSLPFKNGSFDLVIANHVYEHVPDAYKMIQEIYRVLTKGGICYFAGPQKYTIIEPHYGLPFLSWLPKSFADKYLGLFGGTSYYEKPFSPKQLKRLTRPFLVTDYTLSAIKNPRRFAMSHRYQDLLAKIPQFMYKLIYPMLPSFFWVLQK